MTKFILSFSIFFITMHSNYLYAVPSQKFMNALIKVESNGNPYARNKRSSAAGCLQILESTVDDVNRICRILKNGKHYNLVDRHDKDKSIEMCKIYLNYYSSKHTNEEYAKIWNQGPKGIYKKSAHRYWMKVKKYL